MTDSDFAPEPPTVDASALRASIAEHLHAPLAAVQSVQLTSLGEQRTMQGGPIGLQHYRRARR